MSIQILMNLPTITDPFFTYNRLNTKWLLGAIFTYLIQPLSLWVYIIEYDLIMPVGGDFPLLRLLLEITGWVFVSGILSIPVKTYVSYKLGSIFQIVLIFSFPILIWKFLIIS